MQNQVRAVGALGPQYGRAHMPGAMGPQQDRARMPGAMGPQQDRVRMPGAMGPQQIRDSVMPEGTEPVAQSTVTGDTLTLEQGQTFNIVAREPVPEIPGAERLKLEGGLEYIRAPNGQLIPCNLKAAGGGDTRSQSALPESESSGKPANEPQTMAETESASKAARRSEIIDIMAQLPGADHGSNILPGIANEETSLTRLTTLKSHAELKLLLREAWQPIAEDLKSKSSVDAVKELAGHNNGEISTYAKQIIEASVQQYASREIIANLGAAVKTYAEAKSKPAVNKIELSFTFQDDHSLSGGVSSAKVDEIKHALQKKSSNKSGDKPPKDILDDILNRHERKGKETLVKLDDSKGHRLDVQHRVDDMINLQVQKGSESCAKVLIPEVLVTRGTEGGEFATTLLAKIFDGLVESGSKEQGLRTVTIKVKAEADSTSKT
jgi:hypothetical protein